MLQVRSASFDEIQLEVKRCQPDLSPNHPRPEDPGGGFLAVPSTSHQQRSKSFDSTGSGVMLSSEGGGSSGSGVFLEVPGARRFVRRRSSGDKAPPYCVHCVLLEGSTVQFSPTAEEQQLMGSTRLRALSYSDTSTSDDDDADDDDGWESDEEAETSPVEPPHQLTSTLDPCSISIDLCSDDVDPSKSASSILSPQCLITVTLSPTNLSVTPDSQQSPPDESSYSPGRRRSITSAKLERQQAFIFNETGAVTELNIVYPDDHPPPPPPSPIFAQSSSQESDNVIVNQFFLAVPELKRDRAASVDSCFLNKSSAGKAEEVVPAPSGALLVPPPPGSANLRSRSVDIVLPTDQQAHYKALAMNSVSTAQT